MESYSDFAYVYDTFMDNTPYEKWCDYIEKTLTEYNVPKELVVDLGCGTGVLTRMLASRGYNMIGIDNSWEMLSIAREAEESFICVDFDEDIDFEEYNEDDSLEEAFEDGDIDVYVDGEDDFEGEYVDGDIIDDGEYSDDESNQGILYLLQDMREFELYGTVRAVVSVCDSVNYLLTDEDIIKCFKLVNNYLDPGGIFMFDFNTLHKYADVIGNTTIAENREDCSFIWENVYDEESHINEYDLTIFSLDEESGQFDKSIETHLQRGYTVEEMTYFVKAAGLLFVKAVDADTQSEVTLESERVYIIAKECMK